MFRKTYDGFALDILGFELTLTKDKKSGWTGYGNTYRIRLLNTNLEFQRSYWIATGWKVHSRTVDVKEYQKDNIERKRKHGPKEY